MNLFKEHEKLYWNKYTKGLWKQFDGKSMPIELLADDHFMHIPNFMRKRNDRIRRVSDLPEIILLEIERRNMIIDDDFKITKKEKKSTINTKRIKGSNTNKVLLAKIKKR